MCFTKPVSINFQMSSVIVVSKAHSEAAVLDVPGWINKEKSPFACCRIVFNPTDRQPVCSVWWSRMHFRSMVIDWSQRTYCRFSTSTAHVPPLPSAISILHPHTCTWSSTERRMLHYHSVYPIAEQYRMHPSKTRNGNRDIAAAVAERVHMHIDS